MGFHPNDKRSLVIRSKTHTTFFIFLLDKVKYRFYTVCSWKRKYSVFDMKIGFRFARIYANINSFLLYN